MVEESNFMLRQLAPGIRPSYNPGRIVKVDPTKPLMPGTYYPKRLADYEEVVADSGIFHFTLEEFHSATGSTLRCPSLGGTTLDLHKLFVEVTLSGGACKIHGADKWKEVAAAVFEGNLPSFVENVHVELHKCYTSLLFHYEQVYLSGKDVFVIPPECTVGPKLATAVANLTIGESKYRQHSYRAKTIMNVDPRQPPVPGYFYCYPKPLAEYDEVVKDSVLFHSTLKKFHSAMGTAIRHPSLGGKALDLHKLFLKVTDCGGADKIYGPNEWKAVASAVFEEDSPLFVEKDVLVELRQYYVSLLYHYEQVYFCGADIFRLVPKGLCDPEHVIPIAAVKYRGVIPGSLEFADETMVPNHEEEEDRQPSYRAKTVMNVDPMQPPLQGNFYFYPKPLAKYEEVIVDSRLFHSTLKKFHSAMGTTLRYPSIGGKTLDLHKLFLEVTNIGGAEEIHGLDEWKTVAASFFKGDLPSFGENDVLIELRKYYVSLLYHYERAYYLRADIFRMTPGGLCDPEHVIPIAAVKYRDVIPGSLEFADETMVPNHGDEKDREPSYRAKTVMNVDPMQPPVPGNFYFYPKPRAIYEEVIVDSQLFHSTLKKFHSAMGTTLWYPSIGGKTLDLHKLFLEVTNFGGAEEIHGLDEWKTVAAFFFKGDLPSFGENDVLIELRKYYVSLLYHYERAYYLRADIFRMTPGGLCDPKHIIPIAAGNGEEEKELAVGGASKRGGIETNGNLHSPKRPRI